MGKMPGVSLESHLEQVHNFLRASLGEIPNDCLRFVHNETLFFLLTLKRDLLWHYRVKTLHPKPKPFHADGECCLCEWVPMEMTMGELVDYLMDICPYDEPSTPGTEDDAPPPPPEEDTEVDESVGENELRGSKDELEVEPIGEGDRREEPSVEYEPDEDPGGEEPPAEYELEEDPRKDPKEEPLEESDPEEDLMGKEDPEEDPEEDPMEEPFRGE